MEKFGSTREFSEGIRVICINNKYGYIDHSGEYITKCIYDNAFDFKDGRAIVVLDNKYGYIDHLGNMITECKYDKANNYTNGIACVMLDNKWGYLNYKGKEITDIKYSYIEKFNFKDEIVRVEKDNFIGVINKFGEEVMPCKCTYADVYKNFITVVYDGYLMRFELKDGLTNLALIGDIIEQEKKHNNLANVSLQELLSKSNNNVRVLEKK